MSIDFDAQLRLQDLRLRINNDPDYHPTAAEMRELLSDLQQGREAAAAAASRSRAKAKSPRTTAPVDLDTLFRTPHDASR